MKKGPVLHWAELLTPAYSLHLLGREEIEGVRCFVVQATRTAKLASPFEAPKQITLWIAPAHFDLMRVKSAQLADWHTEAHPARFISLRGSSEEFRYKLVNGFALLYESFYDQSDRVAQSGFRRNHSVVWRTDYQRFTTSMKILPATTDDLAAKPDSW